MERKKLTLGAVLFCLFFLVLNGCAARGPAMTRVADSPEAPAPGGVKSFPSFELSPPQNEGDKQYLGLEGTGTFKVEQIKAPFLLIEVFSFYCPYCQEVAPRVEELYRKIDERPDLRGKIKLIGIGATNSLFEVNAFREKYHVAFPLFPDQSRAIFNLLGARGTPTFIGVRLKEKGVVEQFFFSEGAFDDTQRFLAEILKSAGLK